MNLEDRIKRRYLVESNWLLGRVPLDGNGEFGVEYIAAEESARIAALEAEDTAHPIAQTAVVRRDLALTVDLDAIGDPDVRAAFAKAEEEGAVNGTDDEMLRDLSQWLYDFGDSWPSQEMGARLLASEPMQRLRAAWVAEVEHKPLAALSEYAAEHLGGPEVEGTHPLMHLRAVILELEGARPLAMRAARAEERAENLANDVNDLRKALQVARDDAKLSGAALERLRAAQPALPDVGPVERMKPDPGHTPRLRLSSGSEMPGGCSDEYVAEAAAEALAFWRERLTIRAEAAAGSSDDEVDPVYEAAAYALREKGFDEADIHEYATAAATYHRARQAGGAR